MLPFLHSEVVVIESVVDRVEEDRLVLDVPPFPSLPIPLELAPEVREGDAIRFELSREREPGSFAVTVALEGDGLLLAGIGRPFRWPRALAPPGERLWIRVSRKNGVP